MYVIFHRKIARTIKAQDLQKRQEKGARTSFWRSLGCVGFVALGLSTWGPQLGACVPASPLENTLSSVRSIRPHSESK